MKKEYKEIDLAAGYTIEDAMRELKSLDGLYKAEFNGVMLYNDVDHLDSAYMKITGKNKADHDAYVNRQMESRKRIKKEHIMSIPSLTKQWLDKGKAVLDEKYMEYWTECVPIRLGDLYNGMELGMCLAIIKPLNEGCDMKEAKNIIDEQGHSGMSYGLVRSMVRSFCDRGEEFYKNTQY